MATLYPILDRVVSVRNQRWKGGKDYISEKDGEDVLVADVVQINSDGTERQPYTTGY